MFDVKPVRVERKQPSERARYRTPWVPFPEGVETVLTMRDLIARPHEGRPLNLALTGEANFGKSHLLDFFADHYPDLPDAEVPQVQILHVETPAKADGAALVRELMREMGSPYIKRDPLDELIQKFCVRASSLRVLMIIIDEFSNGAWGRREASLTLIHALRSISNRLRRPIVIAGTRSLNDILRNDPQLSERFIRHELPRWTEREAVMRLVKTFERSLELPLCPDLTESDRADSVMQYAGPKLGRIAILLREAELIARQRQAAFVDPEDLEKAASLLPGTLAA